MVLEPVRSRPGELYARVPQAQAVAREQCAIVVGDGEFGMRVAGTSGYQKELEEIANGRTADGADQFCAALLLPDVDNPNDPSAVTVSIDGVTVGYLQRNAAPSFRQELSRCKAVAASCIAQIVGGWDRNGDDHGQFRVRLDASMPFALRDLEADEMPPIVPGGMADFARIPIVARPAKRARRGFEILMPLAAVLAVGVIGAVGAASFNEYHQSVQSVAVAAQDSPPPAKIETQKEQIEKEKIDASKDLATKELAMKDMPIKDVAMFIAPGAPKTAAVFLPMPEDVPQTAGRYEDVSQAADQSDPPPAIQLSAATRIPLPRARPRQPAPVRPENAAGALRSDRPQARIGAEAMVSGQATP